MTTRCAPRISSASSVPRRARVARMTATLRPGANRAASSAELAEFPGAFQQGQALKGFPEPHVVGEHAAEVRVPERGEPGESLLLVGPQHRVQPVRDRDPRLVGTEVQQGLYAFPPAP